MPTATLPAPAEIAAACQTNQAEIAEALTRALDSEFSIEGVSEQHTPLSGGGLAVELQAGDAAFVALLAEPTLLPEWIRTPDATGESKLATLAQELGMLVVPDSVLVEQFQARWVDDLSGLSQAAEGAGVELTLAVGEQQGRLQIHSRPSRAADEVEPEFAEASGPDAESTPRQAPASRRGRGDSFDSLPSYTRSLLKVRLPVVVTLAAKRHTVQEILQLGVGSILQFDKPCDETLDLEVGSRPVAVGEAVKVGEKFGLRVTQVVLPEERFAAVRK